MGRGLATWDSNHMACDIVKLFILINTIVKYVSSTLHINLNSWNWIGTYTYICFSAWTEVIFESINIVCFFILIIIYKLKSNCSFIENNLIIFMNDTKIYQVQNKLIQVLIIYVYIWAGRKKNNLINSIYIWTGVPKDNLIN